MIGKTWILASNSPRRRELFSLFNLQFDTKPADVDESRLPGESPKDYVTRLARKKAFAAAQASPQAELILAADTTVADGEEILGKPEDEADAFRMLSQLRGRCHQVFTAIAIYSVQSNSFVEECCVSDVPMRSYSNEEIRGYIRSLDSMDKAGAYAIQNKQFHPVENFTGCFASVMGLPLCHLKRGIRKLGEVIMVDSAVVCQNYLHYDCPIHAAILAGEDLG